MFSFLFLLQPDLVNFAKVVYLSMAVISVAILNFCHVDICMGLPPLLANRPRTITKSVAKVHWAPAEIQFLLPTDICRRLATAAAVNFSATAINFGGHQALAIN